MLLAPCLITCNQHVLHGLNTTAPHTTPYGQCSRHNEDALSGTQSAAVPLPTDFDDVPSEMNVESGANEDVIDLTNSVSRGRFPLFSYPSAPCMSLRQAAAAMHVDFKTHESACWAVNHNPVLRRRTRTRTCLRFARRTTSTIAKTSLALTPRTSAMPTPAARQVCLCHSMFCVCPTHGPEQHMMHAHADLRSHASFSMLQSPTTVGYPAPTSMLEQVCPQHVLRLLHT